MKCDLESNGWRQGSLARADNIATVLASLIDVISNDAELVVISQSCDLAQPPTVEPSVEAILASKISKVEGHYTNNKNGRTLDLTITLLTDDRSISAGGLAVFGGIVYVLFDAGSQLICLTEPVIYRRLKL